jgi:hypothetical protein
MEENICIPKNTVNINIKEADVTDMLSICPYFDPSRCISAASQLHVWFTDTGNYWQSVWVTILWASCYL